MLGRHQPIRRGIAAISPLTAATAALLGPVACSEPAAEIYDFDGDGTVDATDCGPQDATIYPGAADSCGDGVDQDCDGSDGINGRWCGGQISAGSANACGMKADGTLACWGDNFVGQSNPPDGLFRSVSAGDWVSCAVAVSQELVCWGLKNTSGVDVDAFIPPEGSYESVAVGDSHVCALAAESGTLSCWGDDIWGALEGIPEGSFVQVSAGQGYSCAIDTEAAVHCWGMDTMGRASPPDGIRLKQVAGRNAHSCGIDLDDELVCWGSDPEAEIGGGQSDGTELGTPAGPWGDVGVGVSFTCGRRPTGEMVCWGDTGRVEPKSLEPPEAEFLSLSVALQHSCGITSESEVLCWGVNSKGQLDVP